MDCCSSGFNEILEAISKDGLNSESKVFLSVLFPKPFLDRTFNLLTKDFITCYTANESQRTFWKIGTSKKQYYVFTGSVSYCSCPSFQREVIKEGKYPMCKHCLAIELCNALHRGGKLGSGIAFKLEPVDDAKFSDEILKAANDSILGSKPKKSSAHF